MKNLFTCIYLLLSYVSVAQNIWQHPIASGHSWISFPIETPTSDLESYVASIQEEINMITNLEGLIYLPDWGFNGIGPVAGGDGLFILLNGNSTIEIEGTYLDPSTVSFALEPGWNFIGNSRYTEGAIEEVLSDISGFFIVKDYLGNVYNSNYNCNNIGNYKAGEAYMIYVEESQTIYLPNNLPALPINTSVACNNPMSSNYSNTAITDDHTCNQYPYPTSYTNQYNLSSKKSEVIFIDLTIDALSNLGINQGDVFMVSSEMGGVNSVLAWTEISENSLALTVFDHPALPNLNPLKFYVWNSATAIQYEVFPTFSIGNANYNEDLMYAVISDFSIGEISVCSDLEACNYQEGGTETTTCEYPEAYYDCDGICLNDSNGNDVCDELEQEECTGFFATLSITENIFLEEISYEITNSADEIIFSGDFENFYAENICLTNGLEYTFISLDEFGDGWNGSTYSLINNNCELPIVLANNNNESPEGFYNAEIFTAIDCPEPLPGCIDAVACNFNISATSSDGSCVYPQEFLSCDGNCLNDSNENDVCDELETTGCEDPDACNYIENPFFVVACEYPVPNYDCTNSCINDTNTNGVCDEEEVFGCTVLEALNYNPLATYNDGSCTYSNYCEVPLLENPGAGYNMTLMLINLSSLPIDSEYFIIFSRSSESGLIVGHNSFGNLDQTVLTIFGDDVMTAELDGATNGEAIELQLISNGLLYTLTPNISVNYQNNGIQIIEDFTVTFSCSVIFTGCVDHFACNFNPLAFIDDGTVPCIFPLEYYNCSGNCLSDIDGDEVCDENEIEGCTDEYALNFDNTATEMSECEYLSCSDNLNFLEMSPSFYNANVIIEPNLLPSYLLEESSYIGAFIQDNEGVFTCVGMSQISTNIAFTLNGDNPNTPEIEGASNGQAFSMYALGFNGHLFELLNTVDLVYTDANMYSINSYSLNYMCYQEQATIGCTDTEACNYDELEISTEDCVYADLYFDCEGNCMNDINADGICDELQENGCTDSLACNFSLTALINNGSCTYADVELTYNLITNTIEAQVGGATGFFYNQNWYLNGVLLEGENELNYNTAENGLYTFETTIDVVNPDISDQCFGSDSIAVSSLTTNEIENLITIYPNPASNFVTIHFEKGGAYNLSIYSAIGAVVYQDKLSALETKVNTVNLPNGLYLIKLTKEKFSYTQKIRIQH